MSHTVDSSTLEGSEAPSGLEGLRETPEFSGAVEPADGHDHANDHFALIYETEAELFTGVAPFLRQGLERGEHCLVVLDERPEETFASALQARGVDVEAATDSGDLEFLTVSETYRRRESFDPDAVIAFYEDYLRTAMAEYDGVRVVAGTSWIDEVDFDAFLEYESRINTILEDSQASAMCHYDRDARSPAVIKDIIRTHPHLIADGTVCHNFYYTPPGEFLGVDETGDQVDRMLDTVRDRARAKTDLAEHTRFLQSLCEITADPDRSFESKLQGLFDLGCAHFDLEHGGLYRIDPEADDVGIEYSSDEGDVHESEAELPLPERFWRETIGLDRAACVRGPREPGFDDTRVEESESPTYLGTNVPIDGGPDRILAFLARESPTEPISETDRTDVELMGQWIKYELEHRQYQEDLETTVEDLRQSNDRLKQFAYAASHDLQEPLRMVSTYLQRLDNRYRDDLDDEAQEYVDFAVDGAERMREMVTDLLAYSRVEETGGALEPVASRDVLDTVIEDLQVLIREGDAQITVGSLPTVRADADQLEQVFQNLLTNAIKYSGEAPPRIEITADREGDRWVFSVADDGIGIDPGKTEEIFEVFRRLHHDDEYAGTGIGLALCQEIVENHGGDIWVRSEPGEGSTFSFSLPAVEPSDVDK